MSVGTAAVTLGPLVFSGERLAILLGVFTFMIASGVLASRVSERFNPWSVAVAIGGLIVARLAHVAGHWEYFANDPLRALAVWQGGFAWGWTLLVIAVATPLMLKTRRLQAYALVPVLASALVWNVAYQLASQTEPMAPPALTLTSLGGPPVDLSVVEGRPTVVNLWATWCPPCRREMPALAAAEEAHPDIRFLFVNQGEGPETVQRFLDAQKLQIEHVLFDEAMAVPRHYGTVGIPVTLFLHADGRLAKTHMGEIAPEQIDAEIAALDR